MAGWMEGGKEKIRVIVSRPVKVHWFKKISLFGCSAEVNRYEQRKSRRYSRSGSIFHSKELKECKSIHYLNEAMRGGNIIR